ncbi:hypothetical protein MASR1M12_22270 [Erysipelotrichia bacterium]
MAKNYTKLFTKARYPQAMLQQPEELVSLVDPFSSGYRRFSDAGFEIVASYSRLPGFELHTGQLPHETGAAVLNEQFSLYRRFFGPGATSENGRRRA